MVAVVVSTNGVTFLLCVVDSQKREHARDAMSDVSTSFKVMKNAVTEAQDFFNALMSREPEVATVNQREQPEFMHNLLFR